MSETDLSLVPTDDLIQELRRRVDHMIVSYMQVAIDGPDSFTTTRLFHGNRITCQGLAMETIRTIQEDMRKEDG